MEIRKCSTTHFAFLEEIILIVEYLYKQILQVKSRAGISKLDVFWLRKQSVLEMCKK